MKTIFLLCLLSLPAGAQQVFPQNPQYGQMWKAPNGHHYIYASNGWYLIQNESVIRAMKSCPEHTHLHRTNGWGDPDVIDGPPFRPDGKCHRDDKTDALVKP